jgi:hypothetical protein
MATTEIEIYGRFCNNDVRTQGREYIADEIFDVACFGCHLIDVESIFNLELDLSKILNGL